MSNTVKNILAKVGGTPLVEISNKLNKGGAKVLAKVEYFNPGGSVKDRIALSMVGRPRSRASSSPARRSSSQRAATPA